MAGGARARARQQAGTDVPAHVGGGRALNPGARGRRPVQESLRAAVEDPPRRCAELPRVGGEIRARPEDFQVEELPAYPPDGGEGHVLVWLRKRSLTSEAAARELAKQLGVPRGELGMAGLKDRDAVTRQQLSVPARAAAKLARFEHPQIHVEDPRPHSHKLRRGHLHGNRFTIVVRELKLALETKPQRALALARAQALLDQLAERGLYNLYGAQRFGAQARNLEPGLACLAGRRRAKKGDLTLSAGQSALFNRYLALRAERSGCARVMRGDILKKRASGGLFECADPPVDQARLDAGELVITGPMFGSKMRAPGSETPSGQLEAEVLAEAGISLGKLKKLGRLAPGTRRALLVWPEVLGLRVAEPMVEHQLGPGIELEFVLPAGSYATVLLRELT